MIRKQRGYIRGFVGSCDTYTHQGSLELTYVASGIQQIQHCHNQGELGEQTNLQQRIIQTYIVQCRKRHTTNINSNRDIQIISEILFEHF